LIEKATVEQQAGVNFIALRQAILNFPARYARVMIGLSDQNEAREVLTRATHEFLNELSDFAEKLTSDSLDGENGAPCAEDDGGRA
jgi:hypothetical protein